MDTIDASDVAALAPGIPPHMDRYPEVLIVGGGIIGLATAVFCRRAGLDRAVVIERDHLAAGASGGAGGVLAPDVHALTDPEALVALMRVGFSLHRELDEEWDGALGLRSLDCLEFTSENTSGIPSSLSGVEVLNEAEVQTLEPDLVTRGPGLLARGQASVHPLRLAAAFAQHAGAVATGVEMTDLRVKGGRVTHVQTSAGRFHPAALVFATGLAPQPWVSIPQTTVKGHLIATAAAPVRLRHRVSAEGIGLGQLQDGRLIAGGTFDEGDFSPQVRANVTRVIEKALAKLVPAAGIVDVTHRWCCFRPATADRFPVIDRVSGMDNAWVAAGHYGTGLLLAPATGQAVASWIADGVRPEGIVSMGLSRFKGFGR